MPGLDPGIRQNEDFAERELSDAKLAIAGL